MIDHLEPSPQAPVEYAPVAPVFEATVHHAWHRHVMTWRNAAVLALVGLLVATAMLSWAVVSDEGQLTRANVTIAGYSRDLAAARQQLADTQHQLDTANGQVAKLTSQVTDLNGANKTLQGDLDSAKSQLEGAKNDASRLQQQVDTLRAQVGTLSGQVQQAQAQAAQTGAQLQQLQKNQHPTATAVGCLLGALFARGC